MRAIELGGGGGGEHRCEGLTDRRGIGGGLRQKLWPKAGLMGGDRGGGIETIKSGKDGG